MPITIIIPVLNEGLTLVEMLRPLQSLRAAGHEVILVDGGSHDETCECATGQMDQLLTSTAGRARQMNRGATVAQHSLLLFLHADTRLPDHAVERIEAVVSAGHNWGRFDVRLSGSQPLLRLVEWMMNRRSCLTGIATGDQAIFVQRALFQRVGGYPDIPLMEDVALSGSLRRFGRPACIDTPVVTSSRRWEQGGILRTIGLMWWLRLGYWFGVSPQRLAERYHQAR